MEDMRVVKLGNQSRAEFANEAGCLGAPAPNHER